MTGVWKAKVWEALKLLTIAIVYFAAARTGLLMTSLTGNASPVWPATGVAIVALYLTSPRTWPVIALSYFAAISHHSTLSMLNVFIALGSSMEAVAGAMILRKLAGPHPAQSGNSEQSAIFLAAFLPSVLSATVGNLALLLGSVINVEEFFGSWITWWVGDSLGALFIIPTAFGFCKATRSELWDSAYLKLIFIVAITVVAFYALPVLPLPYLFPLFLALLILAVWLGPLIVRLSAVIVAAVSIMSTVQGKGPFANGVLHENLLNIQLCLATVGIGALVLPRLLNREGRKLLPITILLTSWGIGIIVSEYVARVEASRNEQRFQAFVERSQRTINHRISTYIDSLRAGVSLFSSSSTVSREEWRRFYDSMSIDKRYPGINGVGVIFPVPHHAAEVFEREQSTPDNPFHIHAPGDEFGRGSADSSDGRHYVITYIEPVARNKPAVGLDVGAELNRRTAAELARDTAQPVATKKIVLVQDRKKSPGFLLYYPFYKDAAAAVDSVETRRKAHLGWVYAPFVTGDFFESVLNDVLPEITVEVLETSPTGEQESVFRSSNVDSHSYVASLERKTEITFAQNTFQLLWHPTQLFVKPWDSMQAWVLASIILLGFLLTATVVAISNTGIQAEHIANERMKEVLRLQSLHQATISELRRSESRLAQALEGTNDGVWELDLAAKRIVITGKLLEQFAQSHGESIEYQEFLQHLLGEEDRAVFEEAIKNHHNARGEVLECEIRFKTRQGEVEWLLARGRIRAWDDEGQARLLTGVMVNISALKLAQKKIKEAQVESNLYRSALDSSAIVAFTDANGRLNFVNDHFCSISGYARDELVGQSHHVLNSGRMPSSLFKDLWITISSGKTWRGEICNRAKNGQLFWVETTIVPSLEDNGKVKQYTSISYEITARKKLEEKLMKASEEANAAARAKSAFLANMSHEIRTPMNGVIGMCQLLQERVTDTKSQEMLMIIQRSSYSMLDLLNDILDFSKLEAQKVTLESLPFSVRESIQDVADLQSHIASKKGLRLITEYSKHFPPRIVGDATRFRQVVMNLVTNAIKFTSEGTVIIRSYAERSENGSYQIKVEVEDTGIGIPAEALQRLFSSFSQVDASTTRRFGGSGLGLAIAKGLSECMGGTISVSSAVGRGSTFTFTFPAEAAAEMPQDIPGAKGFHPTNSPAEFALNYPLNMLVAEDNRINQMVIKGILERLGYGVTLVDNGLKALEMVQSSAFDLILMDCHMPEMDGFEAARRIRELGSKVHQPKIVAVTASTMQADVENCKASGMNQILSKPIIVEQLQALLMEIHKDRFSEVA